MKKMFILTIIGISSFNLLAQCKAVFDPVSLLINYSKFIERLPQEISTKEDTLLIFVDSSFSEYSNGHSIFINTKISNDDPSKFKIRGYYLRFSNFTFDCDEAKLFIYSSDSSTIGMVKYIFSENQWYISVEELFGIKE